MLNHIKYMWYKYRTFRNIRGFDNKNINEYYVKLYCEKFTELRKLIHERSYGKVAESFHKLKEENLSIKRQKLFSNIYDYN